MSRRHKKKLDQEEDIVYHIEQIAKNLQPELQEWRRHFHQYPELALQEEKTSEYIVKILKSKCKVSRVKRLSPSGVLAVIRGKQKGKGSMLLRSDMDALPIQEETGLEYASKVAGVMHACGHDAHMAMLLGVAALLQETRSDWGGTVYCLFQPAEETFEGAEVMLRYLKRFRVRPEAVIGLHINPEKALGHVSVRKGIIMAGITIFEVEVHGKEAHGGAKEGANAIVGASDWILQVSNDYSKWINDKNLRVNIGEIESHGRHNIVPGLAVFRGSFRFYEKEDRDIVLREMKEQSRAIEKKHGVKIYVKIIRQSDPVSNDASLVDRVKPVIKKLRLSSDQTYRCMGSEDFSYYEKIAPTLFYFLGVKGSTPHSSTFRMNDNILSTGSVLLASSALECLK